MKESWQGFPYEQERDRSGALLGNVICALSGAVVGFLVGSVAEVATATCDAILRVMP